MESFESFADAATPWLFGLAHALTKNEHDAWDLTQDTLVRLLSAWPHTKMSNPHWYARTTMVRLNVDRLRRLRSHWRLTAPESQVVEDPAADSLEEWLAEGIRGLSPKQRTAVVLRYAEDLSVEAIAVAMQCSNGTARSHLSRGMERLRQLAIRVADAEEVDYGSRG